MPEHMDLALTTGVGEYLEAAYKLAGEDGTVSVPALAGHLGVTAASANEMVRKLAERNLAVYEPYKGVSLTEEGRKQALAVIRRHRLWECFLTDFLEMPWDQVHEEACRLEHATSGQLEARLAEFLAAPKSCPHGHAMPEADGTLQTEALCTIADLKPGQTATIVSVPEEDPALLRYLGKLNLRPSQSVTVVAVEPFDGPVTISTGEQTRSIGQAVASQVKVRPAGEVA